ncbi:MAG: hypothetical protein AAFY26_00830 [Cyanobacteria bacterium J06638_22]
MSENKNDDFIPVNQVLNLKPMLGPIPGEQVVPWVTIVVLSYFICRLLGLGWVTTIVVAIWGAGSWWVLTGDASWRFLSKFQGVPVWMVGRLSYNSPLLEEKPPSDAAKGSPKKGKRQLKKIR